MANDLLTRPTVTNAQDTDFVHLYRSADGAAADKKILIAAFKGSLWPAQLVNYDSVSVGTLVTGVGIAMPVDDTKPQITEGISIFSIANYTPVDADNIIEVHLTVYMRTARPVLALFKNGASDAIGATAGGSGSGQSLSIVSVFSAGAITPMTFEARAGSGVNDVIFVNGSDLAPAGQKFDGVGATSMVVREYSL